MLTMKDIILDGNPILREKAQNAEIPPTTEDIQTLTNMLEFLKNSQDEETREKLQLRAGVGLAAPQIGISKQLIALYFNYEEELYEYLLINPKVVSHSVEKAYLSGGEGCLSVEKDIKGNVIRHARVTVKAFNEKGEPLKLRFKGYPVIVIQHEIDNLRGIMFYDYIKKDNPFYAPEGAQKIE